MPFPAIVAVAAAAGAGTAVAATVVLAAIAEVGLVLTVVGAVTGNATLMKIGGVLGLVGGVGGLIAGAASGGAAAVGAGAAETTADSILAQSAAEAGTALTPTQTSILAQSDAQFGAGAGGATTSPVAGGTVTASDLPPQGAGSGAGAGSAPDAAAGAWEGQGGFTLEGANMAASPTAETASGNLIRAGSVSDNAGALTEVAKPYTPWEDGFQSSSILPRAGEAVPSNSFFDGLKGIWKGLDSKGRVQLLETVAKIPQGISDSRNRDRDYELRKRELDMRSYGSALPIGIIGGARA